MVIKNKEHGKEYTTTREKFFGMSKKAQALFIIVDPNDAGDVTQQSITNTAKPEKKSQQRPATGNRNTNTKSQNAKTDSTKK